jgi:ubiquinone/menaquinone biosynthesis C-methylase UbiE
MKQIILRPNAIPVYGFLSMIKARTELGGKILDCGAGGPVPPLAIFSQQGFETWGIDISEKQLNSARDFCQETGVEINLRQGDMRAMPFEEGFFDYVFEQYAMCHLSKVDTQKAVKEMKRVLKPGGMCFLGVISIETWPRSMFGKEGDPGEFWGEEGGERRRHSLFTNEEADQLVADWEVIKKEKQVHYFQSSDHKASLEEWMARFQETETGPSRDKWQAKYEENAGAFQYHHQYYTLRKS